MGSRIYEYKYSWYYPSLQDDACDPTYKSLTPWPPLHSRLRRSQWKAASRRSARIADKTDERQTDGIGSDHPAARGSLWRRVGFYRGGYHRQGGPVGIGGILGLILVVLVIGWLVHGHIGGLSL